MVVLPCAGAQSARERGAQLFHDKGCAYCHTINGSGGSKGPDLSAVGKRLKKPAIEKQILEGGLNMPPFNDAVTPVEARDLVEYLHKCRRGITTRVDLAGH